LQVHGLQTGVDDRHRDGGTTARRGRHSIGPPSPLRRGGGSGIGKTIQRFCTKSLEHAVLNALRRAPLVSPPARVSGMPLRIMPSARLGRKNSC
jgi:hypothetical protein